MICEGIMPFIPLFMRDIKTFKSLALNNLNTSLINDNNLGIKNFFADLGIFLIEK